MSKAKAKARDRVRATANAEVGNMIRRLRNASGISQESLAGRLGVSRATISQMENGERRVTAGELSKLTRVFGVSADRILGLQDEPEVILSLARKGKRVRRDIRISVPQNNIEKFREVLLYILSKVGSKPNIGETVILKFLYFIDFDYYEKYEEQLIGATYMKNIYGPTPVEFKKIVDTMIEDEQIHRVKSRYFQHPQTKYLPLREPDLSKLTGSEIKVIDSVLNRLSDKNASEISEYVLNDVPCLTTDDGEVIKYESVFYRTAPYSVREYGDEVSRGQSTH